MKFGVRDWLNVYLKWNFMSVSDFKLFLPYLYINQNMAPITLKIMEVENYDTFTLRNQEENNSREEPNREKTHHTI